MESASVSSPILRRIEGNNVELVSPIVDAQFLIGKTWDVSLNLPFEDICDKHCTIEKVDTGKWTVVAHDRACTRLNGEVLTHGLPVLLKCGDFIRVTNRLLFQFECGLVICTRCNPPSSTQDITMTESQSVKRKRYRSDQGKNSRRTRFEYAQIHIEDEDLKNLSKADSAQCSTLHYKQLLSQNADLAGRLKNVEDGIEMLQEQLNRRHKDFEAVESHRNNLSCENEELRSRISHHMENTKSLSNENKILQSENEKLQSDIAELKEKQRELESALDSQIIIEQTTSSEGVTTKLDDLNQSNAAVIEVMTKWTNLLRDEFKCVICHEILIEAMVVNCSHTFCHYCLEKWKAIKPSCPICMSMITRETSNLVVDSYLTNIMQLALPAVRSNWMQVTEERKSLMKNTVSRKRDDATGNFTSSSMSRYSRIRFNFPYPYVLMELHQRLFSNSDNSYGESAAVDGASGAVIDLTSSDEAD